jgi:pSer/pThr/pTyr-binding forkhead associated (FHA) protein
MLKPRIPLPKKALFSAQPYSAVFLNSVFKKLQERPEPFLGILRAEHEQGLLILFILQGEPYAAGGWLDGKHKALSLHEFFQRLAKLNKVKLFLYESDPVYLRCLMGILQKTPSTQVAMDLPKMKELLEHLKQESDERLLVLKRSEELNLFYFSGKRLVEAYWGSENAALEGTSFEDHLLSCIAAGPHSTGEMLLYTDLQVISAPDAHQSISDEVIPAIVDQFLRPCPRLVITDPQQKSREVSIYKKIFSIGRSPENDLMLDDPTVSRKHVTLRENQDEYLLHDEESRNGVRVNSQAVTTVKLTDDDEIQIGGYTLRFMFGKGLDSVPKPDVIANPVEPMAQEGQPFVEGETKFDPGCVLEMKSGPVCGARFEIPESKTVIGRKEADIVIKDPKISTRHAIIEWTAQGYRFLDLKSTNGSFVNGKRVENHVLVSGDMIRMGDTVLEVSILK